MLTVCTRVMLKPKLGPAHRPEYAVPAIWERTTGLSRTAARTPSQPSLVRNLPVYGRSITLQQRVFSLINMVNNTLLLGSTPRSISSYIVNVPYIEHLASCAASPHEEDVCNF